MLYFTAASSAAAPFARVKQTIHFNALPQNIHLLPPPMFFTVVGLIIIVRGPTAFICATLLLLLNAHHPTLTSSIWFPCSKSLNGKPFFESHPVISLQLNVFSALPTE